MSRQGGTSETATVGANGSYTVTMKTSTGCTVTLDTTITISTPIVLTTSTTPSNCTANNGTATVTGITGGTGPFTYAWAPSGGTSATASNLAPGTYTVTVTGAGGCSGTATVTITDVTVTPVPTFSQTNVLCNGGNNGSASVTSVAGGTAPYTYSWSTGATTTTINGLTAGTYTVTVKDAHGCTGTGTVTITAPAAIVITTTNTPTKCTGSTGTAGVATVTGGTSPYTYSWNTGATTSTINALAAGSYTVTVKDANGCTQTATVTVTTTTVTLTPTFSQTNVSCNGGNNGTASVTAVGGGGTAPYTYSWSNGQTGTNATTLAAGTYTVNITDANGCTGTGTVTITAPAPIVINTTSTQTTCSGSTGTASVTSVTGGTSPYTYSWNTGATTSTINALAAGSYTVTVKDANGCTQTATVVVTTTGAVITPNMTMTAVLCNGGSTGTASVTSVTGGTAPYTYSWNGGQTTTNITGQAAGTYTVTVKDANGCTGTGTITITAPPVIAVTTSTTPTTCSGSTGTASINTVTGGTGPYTYSWSTGATTSTINGLAANTYTVTVTDANGCTQTATAIVATTGAVITPTATETNVLCNGGATGSVSVTGVTGGTGPYTYSWSSGQTTTTVAGLTAGTYTITVTDNNGCTGTATTTISQPTALAPTASNTPPLCNGGNGTLTASCTGGTGPYTYAWSDGQTGSPVNDIAGSYTVTVTDANGCTATATTTITQPAPMVITTTSTLATCGTANGSATVTSVTGGTSPYGYSWNTGASTSSITNVVSGTYTVTITDANSCTNTATVVVQNANGPRDSIVATVNVSCFGGNNGSITLGVANGTTPYSFAWSNAATTQNINGLTPGVYNVTVTDANGCTTTATATIMQPAQLRDSIIKITNEPCFGNSLGNISVGDTGGTPAYTYAWTPAGGNAATASNLPAGSYTVTITDANGCTTTANGTITQPAQLTISAAAFPASCNGECNGQLVVIPTGGTTPYNYLWSNGNTNPSGLGVCAGTYSIVVTDANGCTADSTGLIVTQPTPITMTPGTTTAHCMQADGGACVTIGGGTPGYTYAWSTGAVTTCISNVLPTSYSVVVTDANHCTDTLNIVVPNAPGDTALITAVTNVSCNGGNNGSITGGGKGGTPPYTYSWSNGQITQTATGLIAGHYTVTVTDATGCQDTISAVITQPALVVSTPPAPTTICIGQNALLTVTTIGGTPGYTYTWTPSATLSASTGSSVTANPVTTTTYTITTTDANGCPGVPVMVTVTVNPPLNITVTPTKAMCPGGTVTIGATGGGGDGTYTYTWTPGPMTGQTQNVSPAVTTTYTVVLNDGCGTPPVTDSVKVIVDPLPVVAFKADTLQGCAPLCVNFSDLTTITSGGLFSWSWTFGDGGSSNSENPKYCYTNAGVYSVSLTVTSDSGCSSNLTIPNMISVYSHPVAKFTMSPNPAIIVEPTVQFTDQSTDAYGIVSWNWVFNDPADGSSTLQNPVYTYTDTGTYCAQLVIVNKFGCTDTTTGCEVVEPFFTIYIPNAFTPNGDGLNDVFTAKGDYICSFQMYIFDRWGMQLYYTEDINKGWDGTVNGSTNQVQEDTYVYMINAVDCIQHKKHQFLGRVTVIK